MTAWFVGAVASLAGCGSAALPSVPDPTHPHAPMPGDPPPEAVIAVWDGGGLTYAELALEMNNELREMEIAYRTRRYERMTRHLQRMVDASILRAEARARGLETVEQLLVLEVDGTVEGADDDLAESSHALRRERALADRYVKYVASLRERYGVQRSLPHPELPRVELPPGEHDPVEGPSNAAVTVVHFGEVPCHPCMGVERAIQRVQERWQDQVRVVYKDFPVGGHPRAVAYAVALHCAGEQDAFGPLHERLLATRGDLTESDLRAHAAVLGLDVETWDECRASGRHESGIYADLAAGREAGVRAPPAVFVNGLMVAGTPSFERVASLVERELSNP